MQQPSSSRILYYLMSGMDTDPGLALVDSTLTLFERTFIEYLLYILRVPIRHYLKCISSKTRTHNSCLQDPDLLLSLLSACDNDSKPFLSFFLSSTPRLHGRRKLPCFRERYSRTREHSDSKPQTIAPSSCKTVRPHRQTSRSFRIGQHPRVEMPRWIQAVSSYVQAQGDPQARDCLATITCFGGQNEHRSRCGGY